MEVWDALVRPVLLHGVELWGAYPPASGALGDGRRRVESSHTSFLRGLLATRAATPELVVMAETGRFPLALFIAWQVYATWRRLNALDDDVRWVVRAALCDSEALAAEGGSSWAGAVREMMATLAVTGAESPVELEERLRREYAARLSAADGAKTAFYRDAVRGWSGGAELKAWSAPEYLRAALPAGRRAALARLPCASRVLRVETGRWTPVAPPTVGGVRGELVEGILSYAPREKAEHTKSATRAGCCSRKRRSAPASRGGGKREKRFGCKARREARREKEQRKIMCVSSSTSPLPQRRHTRCACSRRTRAGRPAACAARSRARPWGEQREMEKREVL